jgi:regulator of protease activity HflC (stomatin/prohibitin superfamily)
VSEDRSGFFIGCGGVLAFVVAVGLLFWIWPHYNVWASRMHGEAELAQASYNRQVAVQEANAKMHAATLLAEAEVERAKGVAKANQIIGGSLKGNEDYLRYLWIQGLEGSQDKQTIYVPTEAGLPILEANRLQKVTPRPK